MPWRVGAPHRRHLHELPFVVVTMYGVWGYALGAVLRPVFGVWGYGPWSTNDRVADFLFGRRILISPVTVPACCGRRLAVKNR